MHYLEKLGRNVSVLKNCPGEFKNEVMNNFDWVRNLINRLDLLDYEEREKAIAKIHEVLDSDYVKMGYSLEEYEMKR